MRYLFLAGLLFIGGCQVDYEDNERLLFKGTVSDGSQIPFPDLSVEVYASTGNGPFNFNERIGIGKTASDGSFEVVALSPKNTSYLHLGINDNLQEGVRSDIASYSIQHLDILGERDATYTLPDISVEKLTDATFEIRRASNFTDTLYYEYSYKNRRQILDFSQKVQSGEASPNMVSAIGINIPDNITETIDIFDLIVNDTLLLEYRFYNVLETTKAEVIYNAETNSYAFEF